MNVISIDILGSRIGRCDCFLPPVELTEGIPLEHEQSRFLHQEMKALCWTSMMNAETEPWQKGVPT